jgi:beta-apo-4'-carotenal oxygenase
MEMIFKKYLDPTCYTVVQGAVPETTALLNQKWDKIFYTGNHVVGTIVAKKAAETLTPVTLELGGKNPAIVTKNADPRLAARRLTWAKIINAGQVCVSQNWILVDKEILPQFVDELKKVFKEFYPDGAKNSPDYARIVNNRQWIRLKKMLDETKGRILLGGTMDEADRFLEPTVVQVDDVNDSLLTEETFGPLITIYAVNDLDEAIKLANEIHDTPLGVYPFGNKKETDQGRQFALYQICFTEINNVNSPSRSPLWWCVCQRVSNSTRCPLLPGANHPTVASSMPLFPH